MTRAASLGALIGGVIGLGVFVAAAGVSGRAVVAGRSFRPSSTVLRAVALGTVVVTITWLVTGWPTLAVALALGVAATPGIGRPAIRPRDEQELVEAIATWTEQVRDTLSAASGLEQAIGASVAHAPRVLRQPLERLAAHAAYGSLSDGLRRFADEVDNPTADFVVAALSTANDHQARDLGQLLSHVADCARAESRMRSRVWVGRARTRSAVRIVGGVVVTFVLGLAVFNREYLEPYSSASGQVVLAAVLAAFGLGLVLMHQMSRIEVPERFVRRRVSPR